MLSKVPRDKNNNYFYFSGICKKTTASIISKYETVILIALAKILTDKKCRHGSLLRE